MSNSKMMVSPFIQAVPPQPRVSSSRYGGNTPYEKRSGEHTNHVVVDVLTNRVTALSHTLYDKLVRLRYVGPHFVESDLSRREIAEATKHGLLIEDAANLPPPRFESMEVEINRHCNYRCIYCPVSTAPHSKKLMEPDVFRLVLRRGREYGISRLSLNHYSEPTLHPRFTYFAELAATEGYELTVFTNASHLDSRKLQRLAKLPAVSVIANVPSGNADTYAKTTGHGDLHSVLSHLILGKSLGIDVQIVVNAPATYANTEVSALSRILRPEGIPVSSWPTDDRAGRMEPSEYFDSQYHSGLLNGCSLCQNELNVSWQGDVFLCAQDYDQEYRFGSLIENDIAELLSGRNYQKTRGWIFGLEVSPLAFICRRCRWTRTKAKSELSVGCDFRQADAKHYSDIIAKSKISHCAV